MKLAIIGSRNLTDINLKEYIPNEVTEIVSGGARGIDTLAREFAKRNEIKITEFLPDYKKYKKGAPIKRNELIAEYADEAIAFWDGKSTGTMQTVKMFEAHGKSVKIILK